MSTKSTEPSLTIRALIGAVLLIVPASGAGCNGRAAGGELPSHSKNGHLARPIGLAARLDSWRLAHSIWTLSLFKWLQKGEGFPWASHYSFIAS